MWNDVRFALRTLRRAPVFTAVAIASIALGIGANTAIFSLLYQVALRTLPVPDPASLYLLTTNDRNFGWTRSDNNRSVFSYPMYRALHAERNVLRGLAGRTGAPVTIAGDGEPVRATAEIVTGSYFGVLGVAPALGRLLTQDDEARENRVAVLSYAYWESRLARDPGVLNRRILLNGSPVVVVGVAPRAFAGMLSGQSPDVFVPVTMAPVVMPGWDRLENVDAYWLNLVGRLAPGRSAEQATAALLPRFRAALRHHVEQMSGISDRQTMLAKPLKLEPAAQGLNVLRDQWQLPLQVLLGMVGLVLLIACANLAGLLLVRAAARRREMAVRFALGAAPWHVARQLLIESLLLSLIGGLLGAALCGLLTEGLLRLLPEDATGGWLTSTVDIGLLGFSLALAVLTGLLFSAGPVLKAVRWDIAPALKEQTSGLTTAEGQTVGRRAFVAAQAGISVLLLVAAGLFARTLMNLMSASPGFRPEHLITFSVDPALSGYSDERTFAAFDAIEDQLKQLPGAVSVARGAVMPFGGSGWGNGVKAPGTQAASDKYVACMQNAVTGGYFRTLGTPLLAGREFAERDDARAPRVAVLNETFARFLFGAENPIGRKIVIGSNDAEHAVVGVVADSKSGNMREQPGRFLYVPFRQADAEFTRSAAFFIRASGPAEALMASARAVVKETTPAVPVERIASMESLVARSMFVERLLAWMAAGFGLLAVVLAAVGLYGTVAYSTERRIREFGIRLAIGAEPRSLLALVIREAAWLMAIGVAAGLAASYAAARALEAQWYGVSAHDPVTFAAAVAIIAVVTAGAALAPAVRAMRTDPLQALRTE